MLFLLFAFVQNAAVRDWRTLSSDLFRAIDDCDTAEVMHVSESNPRHGYVTACVQPANLVAQTLPLCELSRQYRFSCMTLEDIPVPGRCKHVYSVVYRRPPRVKPPFTTMVEMESICDDIVM